MTNLVMIFAIIFIIFASTVVYKFISNDNLAITSDQVWCSNCQKYHDRETAEQEEAKLVWCIDCQRYHAPGLDENK